MIQCLKHNKFFSASPYVSTKAFYAKLTRE